MTPFFKYLFGISMLAFCSSGVWLNRNPSHSDNRQDELTEQVTRLENRIKALEEILFASKQLGVREAHRRLDRANHQLSDTRDLFMRGLISDAQLEQDRFNALIAQQELDLAQDPGRARQLVIGLDLLDAQRRLEMAKLRLQQTENMNRRGYATLTQIEDARREVSEAREAAAFAQQQLDAAEKLDAMNPPTGESQEKINPAQPDSGR